tara:strand:+ start:1282 stop:1560 length:279 start_codon:yes stop_codon:yes gene_type:complete
MKTKKLTKKQLNILQGVNDSLHTSRIVLKKYKNEDNFKMTSHMQDQIKEHLSGIISFMIYYDLKNFKALESEFDNLRAAKELSVEYLFDNDL